MSNAKNLQRDMQWINIGNNSLTWPTVATAANSDGVVYQDQGNAWCLGTTSGVLNQRVGLWMQQPGAEFVPYRVKIKGRGADDLDAFIAYAQGAITGTNDSIDNSRKVKLPLVNGEFDEVVCLDGISNSNPVFFGVTTNSTSTEILMAISVQRLNVATPRFNSAVS